nr:hypothetical protein [Allomuricauda sp.]
MHQRLILAHLFIFVISVFGLTSLYQFIVNATLELIFAVVHFLIVVLLYILSGFLITAKNKDYSVRNYYIIALIGLILWCVAFLISPDDLHWKRGDGGGVWLFYRIYISGLEIPFSFNGNFSFWSKHMNTNIAFLLTLSIIPSALQAYGGYLKVGWNKNALPKNDPK